MEGTSSDTTKMHLTKKLVSLGKGSLMKAQLYNIHVVPIDFEVHDSMILDDGCTIDTEQGTVSMSSMEGDSVDDFAATGRRNEVVNAEDKLRLHSSDRERGEGDDDYEPVPREIIIEPASCEQSPAMIEEEFVTMLLDQIYADDGDHLPASHIASSSKTRTALTEDVAFQRETFNWTPIDTDYFSLDSLKYYNRQEASG